MKWLAQVGFGLVVAAFVCAALQEVVYGLLCLLAVLIIDLLLEFKYKDDPTISQWIHSLFPKKVDVGIAIGILGLSWWLFGPEGFLLVALGMISGHLFWQEKQD